MKIAALALALFTTSPTFASFTSYSVGNSLTWDAKPPSVAAIAANAGHAGHVVGYHVRASMPLHYIAANPMDHTLTLGPYNRWAEALDVYEWDAITFQPYPGGASISSDAAAISTMVDEALVNPANADTQVYVYAAYPSKPVGAHTLAGMWGQDTSGNDSTTLTRDHMIDVLNAVRAGDTLAEQNALMIPVGDVLAAVDEAMRSGLVPGFASGAELYRDALHLNNVGRFIAATTWYSVMYGEDATGVTIPSEFFGLDGVAEHNDRIIGDPLRDQLQSIAWDVVSDHPFTGVPEPATLALLLGGLLAMSRRP